MGFGCVVVCQYSWEPFEIFLSCRFIPTFCSGQVSLVNLLVNLYPTVYSNLSVSCLWCPSLCFANVGLDVPSNRVGHMTLAVMLTCIIYIKFGELSFWDIKTETNIQIYLSECDTFSTKNDITLCSLGLASNKDPQRAFVSGSALFYIDWVYSTSMSFRWRASLPKW